ncbi:DUF6443 domain-containing protein [Mucilaginibacter terrae]|uniref:RHS repeat-associated protein n=1 Tax=Mucilaginibacter terrae TaxID=1955052 RepID=A0ABU3GUZ5_9SPHI|nr:DUF6443 domain-containing protein [Mucilaginibacter terrae]MDT3403602.1 RHS repeat-associated protein [Mucilaginibacter terrae]
MNVLPTTVMALRALLLLMCIWLLPGKAQGQNGTYMYDAIPAGSFTACGGSYSDYRNNSYYGGVSYSDHVGYPSPEVWYMINADAGTNLSISLCGSNYDTFVRLFDAWGNEVASDDDGGCGGNTSLLQHTIGETGVYYVVVEGYSSNTGDYSLSITAAGGGLPAGANMSNAIDAGTFSGVGYYSDIRSNAPSCIGNDIGQPSNDIFYRFTLTNPATVTLSTCGSGFDTYMHLLNSSGAVVATNDDDNLGNQICTTYNEASLRLTLPPGTYYVVTEGYGTNTGNIAFQFSLSQQAAPNISYAQGSYSFPAGIAISSITPANSGGAPYAYGQTVTVAGNGNIGSTDGIASSASFYQPLGLGTDASGDIYVADTGNDRIRKITTSGTVSTFAGSGTGYADGMGSGASFNHPSSISTDASGNVYVGDQTNNRIRQISPSGYVTTKAGNGYAGYADGAALSASFNIPIGTAMDASGTLYVADTWNHRIRKIAVNGTVSTVAGTGATGMTNGNAFSSSFNYPSAVAIGPSNTLYVLDRYNHAIRKIDASGNVSTFAGNGAQGSADGTGTSAQFYYPTGMVIDKQGNLYVADEYNNRLRKVTPAGVVTTIAGNGIAGSLEGIGTSAMLNMPYGIALDPNGNILTSELGNHKVRKVITAPFSISPALPQGLVFDPATGTISGTPSLATTLTAYTVTVSNASGNSSYVLNISTGGSGSGQGPQPSQDRNYVITRRPRGEYLDENSIRNKTAGEVMADIQYIDGLGRLEQTVQFGGNQDASKDLILPSAYDQFGREAIKYLPYITEIGSNGSFRINAITEQQSFYHPGGAGNSGEMLPNGLVRIPTPYAITNFESSPLNRPIEQGAPGNDWQPTASGIVGAGHTIRKEYKSNLASGDYSVRLYNAELINNLSGEYRYSLTGTGFYAANELYLTITKDENYIEGTANFLGQKHEYKDKEGRIILRRLFNWKNNTIEKLSTYYVYDDSGNLSFILTPGVNPDEQSIPSLSNLNNFCYQYRYDNRRRLIEKKLPGKGWEYYVYNKEDRITFIQDANQRNKQLQEWTFNRYDKMGRVIMTGIWQSGNNGNNNLSSPDPSLRLWLQDWSNNHTPTSANRDNNNLATGYNQDDPPGQVLTINYYDDYLFPGNPFNSSVGNQLLHPTGLLTATKINILGTGNYLWTVNYFDNEGKIIQVKSQNHLGGSDIIDNTYSFTDELLTSTRTHVANGNSTTIDITYDYDHMGRRTRARQSINGATPTVLNQLFYNEVGQVKNKQVGDNLQSIDYSYNERGWLTRVNDPNLAITSNKRFSLELRYNHPLQGSMPQWNGNISEQQYRGQESGNQYVKYSYDKLNRLTEGVSSTGFSETGIVYDAMGNIRDLTRTGPYNATLHYNYNDGNQLSNVTNSGSSFRSYDYDLNGNATSDGQGNSINYNMLNLPAIIPGKGLTYTYTATGQKLKKVFAQGAGSVTDYVSGIQYKTDGTIDFIQTDEGRAIRSGASYNYEYTLKDHLGNNRVTVTSSGQVGEDDYYPFGLNVHRQQNDGNKYLYNSKELQEELVQYDYGARFYDPIIARWFSIDPLAEQSRSWAPYIYGKNNPLRFIDPDGMADQDMYGRDRFDSFGRFITPDARGDIDWLGLGQQSANERANSENENSSETSQDNSAASEQPPGGGNPKEIKTFYVFELLTPFVYHHIKFAIEVLHKPSLLVFSRLGYNERRRLALGYWNNPYYKRPFGWQVDEYPFASTLQGGLGASTVLVPAHENSMQGNHLQLMHFSEGELFRVKLIPYKGLEPVVVPVLETKRTPAYSPSYTIPYSAPKLNKGVVAGGVFATFLTYLMYLSLAI